MRGMIRIPNISILQQLESLVSERFIAGIISLTEDTALLMKVSRGRKFSYNPEYSESISTQNPPTLDKARVLFSQSDGCNQYHISVNRNISEYASNQKVLTFEEYECFILTDNTIR